MNLRSFSLYRNYSYPADFVKCRRTLLELNSKGPYPSAEIETQFRRCFFTSSIKRGNRRFHVVVLQKRAKKCTKKRGARAFDVLVAVRVVGTLSP